MTSMTACKQHGKLHKVSPEVVRQDTTYMIIDGTTYVCFCSQDINALS